MSCSKKNKDAIVSGEGQEQGGDGGWGHRGNSWWCSVTKSCLTFSWPHGLQHTRLPCPSPSSGVCPSSCPLNQWYHPAISSSSTLFFYFQSFPVTESFPMSQLFISGGQSIGVSASASILPVNIQGWFQKPCIQTRRFMKIMCPAKEQSVESHGLWSTRQRAGLPEDGACDLFSPRIMRFCSYWRAHILVHAPGAFTKGKKDKPFQSRSHPV